MMKAPIGVAILGFLALLQGVMAAFYGIVYLGVVAFGPAVTGEGIALAGSLSLIVGLVWIAVAGAAWSLQPWAWLFGVIMAIFGLISAIILMLASESLVWGLASALLPIIVLWYLNQPHIRDAFGIASS